MNDIERIKKPIKAELAQFNELFTSTVTTENPLLSEIYSYVLKTNGKQMRPILVLLSAKLCGSVSRSTLLSAVALELLHTASLLHDDVVDNTFERRGEESVNSLWNNKVAVLSGDHLLSIGISLVGEINRKDILDAFSLLGKNLAEGELLQLSSPLNLSDENKYFEIITKKTAILFSTCLLVGALSSNATIEEVGKLSLFGEYLGLCFQIKDDLFDYTNSKEIGKPTANDIREKKITLPLIYALNHSIGEEKNRMISLLENGDFNDKTINELIRFAHEKGGIQYAEEKMTNYEQKAIALLDSFANEEIKQSLIDVLAYSINRKK